MSDTYNLIYEVTKQIKETEEEFIIKTITPLVETVTEQKVNKKELTTALLNYYNPSFPTFNEGIRCNRCNNRLDYNPAKLRGRNEVYCYNCGRRIKLR